MEKSVLFYLANAAWQTPMLAALVALLLWAVSAPLRLRHLAWIATLLTALILPLTLNNEPRPAPVQVTAAQLASAPPIVQNPHPAALPANPQPQTEPIAEAKPFFVIGPAAARWCTRIYLLVTALAAGRILLSWLAARRLVRRSRPLSLAPRAMAIFTQAAQSQKVVLPLLRQSAEIGSPMVIGAYRPALLLPTSFNLLKEDEITAALCHELAHLKREDYLINLLCQLIALPLIWHPATHLILRRIRDSREMICDQVAADEMKSPLHYATCLVAVALRSFDSPARATQAVSMFDNRVLEERIHHLTQKRRIVAPVARMLRLAGGAAATLGAVALTLLFQVTPTFAEQPPVPPVPPSPPVIESPVAPIVPVPPSPPAVDQDMRRSIDAEANERAAKQREERGRDEQAKRDAQQARRDIDQAKRDADEAKRDAERDAAEAKREAELERREAERERRDAARESAREASQAAREAAREARQHADEMRERIQREVADAMRATEHLKDPEFRRHIEMQVEQAKAMANSPEFRQQMDQLHENMAELHRNMADLDKQMKQLSKNMSHLRDNPVN